MHKKAQASTEFLMTYGWAILAVLIAVAALAYFGFVSGDGIVPSKCIFPAPVPCVDHSFDMSAEKLTIALRNNNGFPVEITGFVAVDTGCSSPSVDTVNGIVPPQTVANDDIARVVISCPGLSQGRFRSDVTLMYNTPETGLNHSHTGEIVERLS